VSPSIDIGLNGGIPTGSWVTFSGLEKCGKTYSALDFASTCQKSEYGGMEVYYANIECRLKKMNLTGTNGLNLDKFHVIESTPGNILSAEKYLSIIERIMLNTTNTVMIIDSISAFMTEKEQISGMEEMQRADGAKLFAKFTRKMSNVVPVNSNIIIGILHLGANVSGYGASYIESGGQKIKYQVDVRVQAKSVEPWEVKGVRIGQIVTWLALASALGPPGAKVKSYIRYGYGIDKLYETMVLAIDIGIISKGGSWFSYGEQEIDGEKTPLVKIQGEDNFYQWMLENTNDAIEIQNRVTRMFLK